MRSFILRAEAVVSVYVRIARTTSPFVTRLSSFQHAWSVSCRVNPTLAALPVDSPTTTALAALRDAHAVALATFNATRARHAALDSTKRTWTDGTVHSAYHPRLPATHAPPATHTAMVGDAQSFSQRTRGF